MVRSRSLENTHAPDTKYISYWDTLLTNACSLTRRDCACQCASFTLFDCVNVARIITDTHASKILLPASLDEKKQQNNNNNKTMKNQMFL